MVWCGKVGVIGLAVNIPRGWLGSELSYCSFGTSRQNWLGEGGFSCSRRRKVRLGGLDFFCRSRRNLVISGLAGFVSR